MAQIKQGCTVLPLYKKKRGMASGGKSEKRNKKNKRKQ
jgi:hypothetical protein